MKTPECTVKKCRETRVIQTHRIFPGDLNSFGALFGGKLMAFIDDTASISAARHSRSDVMTASTDELNFLHPIMDHHSVCVESYVTGTGRKSMEVFIKVIGEVLTTGERYLAATSFMTFVAVNTPDSFTKVPEITPETEEEKQICANYQKRRQRRLEQLSDNEAFAEHISLAIPWIDD
ncbi:acyl-CoA thioesterase [Vagococcus acidifermentans]|uniref:Acyl-CoA thioesterase n=1 Tax=Vagococcus acidifermentans TaxID=564710 RepID=A0A430AP92_9ENTE|nr:acyl-CoA thioesterase [Vagococcus acidifermentans]RSU09793.1 acyl-CoA thioesterase [Vagococcus acidifermentans]